MAKFFGIFSLFIILTSCTSVNSNADRRRALATEEIVIDEAKVIKLLRDILAYHRQENRDYKVVNFPLNSPGDVSPQSAASEVVRVYQDPAFIDSWETLGPLYANVGGNAIYKKFRSIITGALSLEDRNTLLNVCFLGPLRSGDPFYISSYLSMAMCGQASIFHKDSEVLIAMDTFPKAPRGVKYDGDYGFHVYQDNVLENKVQIITAAINTNRENIYKVYHSQSAKLKGKFSANTNGASESSKIEPFDLIATYSTAYFIKKNMGADPDSSVPLDKIQIGKLSQKALARFFHMTQKIHDPINKTPSLSVFKTQDSVSILCANGMFPRRDTQYSGNQYWYRNQFGTDLVESWKPAQDLRSFVATGFSASNLTCNLLEYRFLFQKVPAEIIPAPSDIKFANEKDIHGLMTVSLVSEIDHAAVDKAKLFVKSLTGWEVEGDIQEVDTMDYIKQNFAKFDLYFPVMHAMDVNYFNIGTKSSLLVKIKKSTTNKSGNKVALHLHVLLPDGSKTFDGVTLKPNDLAELLDVRYQSKKSSIFIMNNSCSSESTLLAWTLVYRKALKLRQKRGDNFNSDMPHIIGSSRSFGTSGLMEIFSHSTFPLKSFELLANGSSVADVVDFLRKPQESSFLGALSGFFNKEASVDVADELGFAPVYVMEYPELLSMGGIKITVTGRTIKAQDEY